MNAGGNASLVVDFVDEALESLQRLPQLLDSHRHCPQDDAPINAVFRAVHSMKGCAAFLDLTAIKGFAHSLEGGLDKIRSGHTRLDEPLQRLLIEGLDELEAMLHAAMDGAVATALTEPQQKILDRIGTAVAASSVQVAPENAVASQLLQLADELAASGLPCAAEWAERFRLAANLGQESPADSQSDGARAGSTRRLDELRGARFFCDQQDVTASVAAILELFVAHRENRYNHQVALAFLEAVDRFAAEPVVIARPSLCEALRQTACDFRTILDSPLDVDRGVLDILWDRLGPAIEPLEERPEPATPEADRSEEHAAEATPADSENAGASGVKTRFMRVKEDKLDEFLEQVSRMFITVELFQDLEARMSRSHRMDAMVEEMRQINRELKGQSTALQQGVMGLRRVAVAGLFSKFPRMARSLAAQLGKGVDVHVSGEETEIDKVLVDDLDAALTHLIRNSVDHGIDTPAERQARGASEVGNLWLKAEQVRGRIRITVQDDGRGIDPVRLRHKAVEKGVLSQAEADALSDEKAVNLIFHPGFSTAERVSEVSGRGVGMDAVRAAVEEHRGEVSVESSPGQGTTICLDIPVRNAVVVTDSLLVEHAGQRFVIPFEYILEIAELGPTDLKPVQGRHVITMRDTTYAAVSLSQVLELETLDHDAHLPQGAILVHSKHGAVCLLVDSVLGHRQAVINRLEDVLAGHEKLSGVSPLGGGRLALVLNVPAVIQSFQT